MDPFKSYAIYPRPDTMYKSKESQEYDAFRSNLYQTRPGGNRIPIFQWAVCFIIGLLMAFLAFWIDYFVDELVFWKWQLAQRLLDQGLGLGIGYIVFLVMSCVLMFIAIMMTLHISPVA